MKKILLSTTFAVFAFMANAQNVIIPDSNFKDYLLNHNAINTNNDSEIQVSEAAAFAGVMDCSHLYISDLTGIEAFTSLVELYCTNNSLSSLDLTGCANLEVVECQSNMMGSINVFQNLALKRLVAFGNHFGTIDVSQNTALEELLVSNNKLSSIVVSNNAALQKFNCSGNPISSLNVTQNTALINLNVGDTYIEELDLSQNTTLSVFQGYNTRLYALNIANGNFANISNSDFNVLNNPNLTCIQVDDLAYSDDNWFNIDAMANFSVSPCTPSGLPRIYVDADATGAGDGSSWADAYSDLSNALENVGQITAEIWIAEGTYLPHASASTESFEFYKNNLTVYGGFDGTETLLKDRDVAAHPTLLSGDLNGNDADVNFNEATRSENSNVITRINGMGITFDGLQIANGDNSEETSESYGSAILISGYVTSFNLKRCQLKNNVSRNSGVVRAYFVNNCEVNIENCIIDNNMSRFGAIVLLAFRSNITIDVNVVNSLFTANKSLDYDGSNLGYTGSALTVRTANIPRSVSNTNVTNCTFANNLDVGSAPSEKGPLAFGREHPTCSQNATISNSIFYGNKKLQGSTPVTSTSVNKGHLTLDIDNVSISNSIGEDNFVNIANVSSSSDADPLFTNASNKDFTLQSGSSAIDSGDNTKVPNGVYADLLGNMRIHNGTVDRGVYEFGAPVASILVTDISVQGQGGVSVITTNGGSLQMEATVLPVDATDETYTWSVNNGTGAATIDANGLLTASENGTVEVVATANDASGVSGSATITISNQTVGVEDETLENLTVYPNPASSVLNIETSQIIKQVSIFSALGEKLVQTKENTITVAHLPQGIYLVRIEGENGSMITKRFIKK